MLWKQDGVHGSWSKARRLEAFWILTLALALALACGACGGGTALTPLTPEDIAESGTLVLDAPQHAVLDASVLALQKQGYAIDAADLGTGLVVTFRRPVEPGSQPGARLFRAYILEVKSVQGDRVRVSAWPAVSEADVARGNRPYTAAAWEMDEERAAWARLFEDIRGLVERASP